MACLYTIFLFGRLRVQRHTAEIYTHDSLGSDSWKRETSSLPCIDRFRTQKTGSLLAYLAHFAGQKHSREVLADTLWPDSSPESGRQNLRMALASLRAQLEPDPILPGSVFYVDRAQLGITGAVTTDVAQFEHLVDSAGLLPANSRERAGLLENAIALYRREMLPGYYDEWIVPEQERIAERWRTSVLCLSDFAVACGNKALALSRIRQAEEIFPEDEDVLAALERLGRAPLSEMRSRGVLNSAPTANQIKLVRRRTHEVITSGSDPTIVRDEAQRKIGKIPLEKNILEITKHETSAKPDGGRIGFAVSPVVLPPTRFFGRQGEQQRLLSLMVDPSVRLVTITGPGGIGKTRLMRETVEKMCRHSAVRGAEPEAYGNSDERYDPPQRIGAIVDASVLQADDSQALLRAISTSLGVDSDSADAVVDAFALGEILRRQPRSLLILDNFESVLPTAADAIALLLGAVSNIECLITSRVRLGIAGESVFEMEPLPVPPPLANLSGSVFDVSDYANEWPSIALFLDRGQQSHPDFALTHRNLRSVVSIVRFLDGLPLAIELAAARIQLLTPTEILTRLKKDRFAVLAGSGRRFGPRHMNLRETLSWSVEFLSPPARRFLGELAVFQGGFTQDAATELMRSDCVLEILTELSDASLVCVMRDETSSRSLTMLDREDGELPVRFYFLETVRTFARSLLSDDEFDALSERHAMIFSKLAQTIGPRLENGNLRTDLDLMDAERANLRTALEWLLHNCARSGPLELSPSGDQAESHHSSDNTVAALQIASATYRYWILRGGVAEGRRWLEAAIASTRPDPTEIAITPNMASAKAPTGADNMPIPAQSVLDPMLSAPRAKMPVQATVWASAVNRLGILAMTQGDLLAAEDNFNAALSIRRELDQRRGIAAALSNLGIVAAKNGDHSAAWEYGAESLALWRELGDGVLAAAALSNLAMLAYDAGNEDIAEPLLRDSIRESSNTGNPYGEALNRCNLGEILLSKNCLAEAEREFRTSLGIAVSLEATAPIAHCLLNLAYLGFVGIDTPQRPVDLALRLRSAGFRLLSALDVPRSRFILEQERNWFEQIGFLDDDANSGKWDRVEELAPQSRTHPTAVLLASDSVTQAQLLVEHEIEAASNFALLLARQVLAGASWFGNDSDQFADNEIINLISRTRDMPFVTYESAQPPGPRKNDFRVAAT